MKIYRPLKTNQLTQGFGKDNTFRHLKPWYEGMGLEGHSGTDWRCWRGEPIYHSGDWKGVAKTEVDRSGGIGVDVKNTDLGFKLRYWHLQKVNVYDGQEVQFGQLIGWGNNTGLSTGDHLHFALKCIDEQGRTTNTNNGYRGAIDMAPFFENKSIQEVLQIKISLTKQLLELALKIQGLIKRRKHKLE